MMKRIFYWFENLAIFFIVIFPGISSAQVTNIHSEYPHKSHINLSDSTINPKNQLLTSFEEKQRIWKTAGRKSTNGRKVNSITSIRYLFNSPVDSISEQKITEIYDEDGRVTMKSTSTWSVENSIWIEIEKEEWGYNKLGNTNSPWGGDISIYQRWDWNDKKEQLVNAIKEIWIFNSQGNVIKHDEYRWDFYTEELYLAATAGREYYESGIIAYRYSIFFDKEGNPYEKTEITYNEFGREVKWDYFIKEETDDELVHIMEYFLEWDDEGNLLLEEGYHFDKGLNEWIGREKREFSYDTEDKVSEKIVYDWDYDTDNWSVASKTEISYVGSLVRISIESYWDEIDSEWRFQEKNEKTVNSEGDLVLWITYSWSIVEDGWIYDQKTEYPRKAFYINYYWNASKNEWIPKYKFDHSSENGTTYYLMDTWDEISNQWICHTSSVNKENEYGDFIYNELSLFQEDVNECVLIVLENKDYAYDDGKVLSSVYYMWQENDSTYEKKDFIYSENGDLLIEEIYNWDYQELIWVLAAKEFYQYEEMIITEIVDQETKINMYPNPVESYLHVDHMIKPVSVNIQSVQGKSLIQTTIFNEPIDLQLLSPGVYIIIIKQEGKQASSRKIVKR